MWTTTSSFVVSHIPSSTYQQAHSGRHSCSESVTSERYMMPGPTPSCLISIGLASTETIPMRSLVTSVIIYPRVSNRNPARTSTSHWKCWLSPLLFISRSQTVGVASEYCILIKFLMRKRGRTWFDDEIPSVPSKVMGKSSEIQHNFSAPSLC